MKKIFILISRLYAQHKILQILFCILVIVFCMLFLDERLKNVGVITSSIITSYLYNLFANAKKQLDEEMNRMEQEEMIR